MAKQIIRKTFFGLFTIALLSVPVNDLFAQRTTLHSERRTGDLRASRGTVKKERVVKSDRKTNSSKEINKPNERKTSSYRVNKSVNRNRNMNRDNSHQKKDYRRSKNDHKYFGRSRGHNKHYRKPSWADFYHRGFSYPRIGAHFSFLPGGFISFRIGDFRFYSYHGVYYRFDPVLRVYVVIKKPVIKTDYTSTKWDRITLVDGSTIEGVYLGGDNETIQFEVGDAILEIPMSEIKVLTFAEE